MTASHTTVVTATVMSMMWAKSIGWSLSSPKASCRKSETTNAVTIAETSLQALMRHQYQRSSSTPPVPAPVTMSSFHAPAMDSSLSVTSADTIVRNTVATFDAST